MQVLIRLDRILKGGLCHPTPSTQVRSFLSLPERKRSTKEHDPILPQHLSESYFYYFPLTTLIVLSVCFGNLESWHFISNNFICLSDQLG